MQETMLKQQPPQHQDHKPGSEQEMTPKPLTDDPDYKAAGKLQGKVALITGGDSGIGKAVAIVFAKEGADVAISFLNEFPDAEETKQQIERYGRKCLLLPGDIGDETHCVKIVEDTIQQLGKLDILVNNAGEHYEQPSIADLTREQIEMTFRTNVFSVFYLSKAALQHMKEGSTIINTASVTAYKGSSHLLDYSTTKGALVTFTRSLAQQVVDKGIRVNAVAPGPFWTPLIAASFPPEEVAEFGKDVPMGRPGQPAEIAPYYVFLASTDSSYMSGQVLHGNGGTVVNG